MVVVYIIFWLIIGCHVETCTCNAGAAVGSAVVESEAQGVARVDGGIRPPPPCGSTFLPTYSR